MILAIAFGRTVTAGQAKKEFGVSPATLKTWARRGWLQTVNPTPGRVRYSRDEIIRLVAFGEDWAGRKVINAGGDARRLRDAAGAVDIEPEWAGNGNDGRWRF